MTSYTFDELIDFTRTTSAKYVDATGQIATAAINAPRFDYDPVTLQAKGFLIEAQRSNLFLYSAQFTNPVWYAAGGSVTADSAVAPDGTSSADKLTEDNSSGGHYVVYQSAPVTSGTTYTASVYLKPNGRTWARIQFLTGFTSSASWFDLATGTTGTVGTSSATITDAGNGWYRITATQTATSSTNSVIFLSMESANNGNSYVGNGTSGMYYWGAQFEAGSFASSYIPTVASQVTRTADQAVIQAGAFTPWYNATEGTLVCEYDTILATDSAVKNIATISDGTANNRITAYVTATTGLPFWLVTDGGVTQASAANTIIGNNVAVKTAAAYKVNDFAIVTNGGAAGTDVSGTVPSAVDRLYIGGSATGALPINGHIRSIRYYPSRLVNATLQSLTA